MNKDEMAQFYRKIDVILRPIPEIPSLPIYETNCCGEPKVFKEKIGNNTEVA